MKSKEMGFTLIEMMIAVAVVGILAAVAIPAYRGYMERAKTVEVTESLDKIATGTKAYYMNHSRFPDKSGGYAPTRGHVWACRKYGGVFPEENVKADFNKDPWNAIGFMPGRNLRYRYRLIVSQPRQNKRRRAGGYVYIDALGDLNCDKKYAQWRVTLREVDREAGSVTKQGPYMLKGDAID